MTLASMPTARFTNPQVDISRDEVFILAEYLWKIFGEDENKSPDCERGCTVTQTVFIYMQAQQN